MPPRFFKVLAENRRARHDYLIVDTFQAGIALRGTEVKSIRIGQVSLKESFARVDKGEVWIHGMHVTAYRFGREEQQHPTRPRKLLLKTSEIRKLIGRTQEKGLTLIPLKLYLHGNWVKVDLALARAKKLHEKRETLRRKAVDRDIERALQERSRKRE